MNDPFRTRGFGVLQLRTGVYVVVGPGAKPKPEAIAVTWRDFVLLSRLLLRLVHRILVLCCVSIGSIVPLD